MKFVYKKPIIDFVVYKSSDVITASSLRASATDDSEQPEIALNTSGMLGFKTKS